MKFTVECSLQSLEQQSADRIHTRMLMTTDDSHVAAAVKQIDGEDYVYTKHLFTKLVVQK